jgi:protease-4
LNSEISSSEPPVPPPNAGGNNAGQWERQVLERLVRSVVDEQRRSRKWGIFFKTLTFIYLFSLLFLALGWLGGKDKSLVGRHTAMVEINGVISADGEASADHINAGLQQAFKDSNTAGVIVRINSPGGSPVQAGQINQEIRRLRGLHPKVPLYVVVDDICASGGYYVAVAGDRIYVDQASIVGSIGVLIDGFGFTGTMDKLGVDRRLFTAGNNKGFLDPFSPLNPGQRDYALKMIGDIHRQFIDVVKQGRGDRLKDSPELFSGLVWTGQKSIELGLADALGTVDYVAREVIKADTIVDFTPHENLAERFARRFGATMAETLVGTAGGPRLR